MRESVLLPIALAAATLLLIFAPVLIVPRRHP